MNDCSTAEYAQMKKNTVRAAEQLNQACPIRFYHPDGKGKRVLFAGNSITLHGICAEIGWHGEWGMAASSPENDYVHRLMAAIQEKDPDSAFCVCQVAEWERQYQNGKSVLPLLENARNFHADIIVMRFVENCPWDAFDREVFKTETLNLLRYLNPSDTGSIILTTGFWRHPADDAIAELAKEFRFPLVELGDLGERDEMKAIGLFAHSGVANHPGDLGMKNIADRIFEALQNYL